MLHLWKSFDWEQAEHELRATIALNPEQASDPRPMYGCCLLRPRGRFNDALMEMDAALDVKPLASHFRYFKPGK